MENIIKRTVRKNFSEDFNDEEYDDRDINDIHSFPQDFDDTERFSNGFDERLRSSSGSENESGNVCLINLYIIIIVWIIIITHYVFQFLIFFQ